MHKILIIIFLEHFMLLTKMTIRALIEDKAAVVAACGDALIWEDSMMSRMLGGEFVVADVDARDRTYHLCRPEHLEIAKSMHEFWWPFVACIVLDPVPGEAEA